MRMTVLALSLSIMVCGCVTGTAGPEGNASYVWYKGTLEANLQHPLNEVEAATRTALEELDLVAIDSAVDGLEGKLTARMASGSKVTVKLKALDLESTGVSVRVGTFGDKAASEQIMRYIDRQLGGS
jgi:hypothetical protein